MKRIISVCAFLAATSAALSAQQSTNPYQGTSNPPPDATITTPDAQSAPIAKPSPSTYAQPAPPALPQPAPAQQYSQPYAPPAPVSAPRNYAQPGAQPQDGTDDGIVLVAPDASAQQPALNQRANLADPDGDIVHPGPLPPGELAEGTMIRVRLLDRLSTAESQPGEKFRTRVASDVFQGDQVLIPVGSEIEGQVVSVSTGHAGGHGSMHLRPETVILPNGSRFRLYAELTGAPGSRTRVGGEGGVTPGSQLKKDGIEYGGAVGAGLVTGAVLGGPGGALAGTLIGAGVITVHLIVSHPQATLENGTVLLFTLDQPLNLVAAASTGN